MRSAAWVGDRKVNQPWGCTTYAAEPWYAVLGCHFHCGIDIAMALGDLVFAARDCVVRGVGVGFLCAQAGSEMDWYLHCSSYVVGVGASVRVGQLLGYAGSVAPPGGASDGPHLHFERQSTLALICNIPRTSLDPVPVLETVAPASQTKRRRIYTMATANGTHQALRGRDRALYYRRFAQGVWSPWTKLGGGLIDDVIVPATDGDKFIGWSINGLDTAIWDCVSADGGQTWTWTPSHGGGDGMVSVGAAAPALSGPVIVDLSALEAAEAAEKAALDALQADVKAIKAKTDKDLG